MVRILVQRSFRYGRGQEHQADPTRQVRRFHAQVNHTILPRIRESLRHLQYFRRSIMSCSISEPKRGLTT